MRQAGRRLGCDFCLIHPWAQTGFLRIPWGLFHFLVLNQSQWAMLPFQRAWLHDFKDLNTEIMWLYDLEGKNSKAFPEVVGSLHGVANHWVKIQLRSVHAQVLGSFGAGGLFPSAHVVARSSPASDFNFHHIFENRVVTAAYEMLCDQTAGIIL